MIEMKFVGHNLFEQNRFGKEQDQFETGFKTAANRF